ncbi:keratin, type II cytoskeletal cochleal-like [Sesbania bispinosa]|nr:keratin, type II cytoskeletal cochleal-like [Sesbania bispinosa]
MRTVITVRSVIVIVICVGIRGSSRGRNVDPFLLPLPHRSSEHRGRSVTGRGPPKSGPNSLHPTQICAPHSGDGLRSVPLSS